MKEYLNKDLYEILGTTFEADVVTIKSAYRKKARIYHPDVNNNTPESIEMFKEITEAYEFLLDTQKRKQYDEIKGFTAKRAQNSAAQRAGAQRAYSYANERTSKSSETKNESYHQSASVNREKQTGVNSDKQSFSSVFTSILDGLFPDETPVKTKPHKNKKNENTKSKVKSKENVQGQAKKSVTAKNGRDINLSVTIKIDEALNGTHRTVNVLHMEVCPKCEGRKFINGSKCPMCKGTGEVSLHKKLNVKIPARVKKGAKIRIANEGNQGCNGGTDGDLFLTIDIEENTFFKYEGLNVSCEIPITPYEAALGANIEIPSLSSTLSMKIPAGTTTGQKFRLSGEGLSDGKKRGDQIVTVKIEMPKNISEEEKELYEKLKNLSKTNIRENLT